MIRWRYECSIRKRRTSLWEDHINGVNEGTKNETAKHRAKAINTMLQLMSATRMPFFLKKWDLVVGRATVSQ